MLLKPEPLEADFCEMPVAPVATAIKAEDSAAGDTADDTAIAVEWNFGIWWRWQRCYINIRRGAERRNHERLLSDGHVQLPLTIMAYATGGTILFGLFGLVCFLYLLKSMSGLEFFPGASPLHPLYEFLFQ